MELDSTLTKILNKQFQILGLQIKFSDIPESGIITYKEGKKEKKDYWYNVYKFTKKQESEWKEWALEELKKIHSKEDAESILRDLELRYGFSIRYTKEEELF